jgi:hypothetical protein
MRERDQRDEGGDHDRQGELEKHGGFSCGIVDVCPERLIWMRSNRVLRL